MLFPDPAAESKDRVLLFFGSFNLQHPPPLLSNARSNGNSMKTRILPCG
jgi:hypothetical protein